MTLYHLFPGFQDTSSESLTLWQERATVGINMNGKEICMNIRLSDHFTYGKLLRFCMSPMIMMVFTSIYGVVDGFLFPIFLAGRC